MRFLKSIALATVLLFSVFTLKSVALSQYFPLTPSQAHFTHILTQLKTFKKVEWTSPVSMWVLVSPSQKGRAQALADTIQQRARDALMQPFCVHIFVKEGQSVARSCVF